jgi:hypothetical protein
MPDSNTNKIAYVVTPDFNYSQWMLQIITFLAGSGCAQSNLSKKLLIDGTFKWEPCPYPKLPM